MPYVISMEGYGVIVVDREKRLLWEWIHLTPMLGRIAGIDVDPHTGNIYVAEAAEILEVSREGQVVWRYSHPKMGDLHGLQCLPNGNILVASAATDRALEVNKREGVVWEWWAADYYTPPEWYKDYPDWRELRGVKLDQWTHLNHAWRVGDETLISLMWGLKRVLKVSREGKVLWEFRGGGRKLSSIHYVIPSPRKERYLLSNSGPGEVIEFTPEGEITWLFKDIYGRCIDVLPNGNLLLSDDTKRFRVVEVTWDKEIVWEYKLPDRIIKECRNPCIYTAKHWPEWGIPLTEEDQKKISERLRALGYLG